MELPALHQFVACGKSRKAVRFDMNQPSRQQVTYQVPTAGKHQKTFFEFLSLLPASPAALNISKASVTKAMLRGKKLIDMNQSLWDLFKRGEKWPH